ncbi:thiopurine S-methyltransferase [Arsukibacterium tuosuense]|uniref:Thiopurine S-methyltransferase n=1 Tax=Arsukibacterium tuosuense TaxID=1323745 RepID=A0A285IZ64_9GAMM|nr:thiopurine S-methyltransferase [Arsukibacterium tuosuense]SNY52201.1 thiopurine S-methyltransferase [Arsukibacterium tuosuense]
MDPDFWQEKWQKREIAFHQAAANPLLVNHFSQLSIAPGARVFLPLCGKSLDSHWLLACGYRVVGAELSEVAVKELFAELGLTPSVSTVGKLQHYSADKLEVFVGDIFELSEATLGPVAAIYDRAALVALPDTMRQRYAQHLITISQGAPQLVICFEYDQAQLAGPPFSVDSAEMHNLYSNAYHLNCLEQREVPGGLKKKCQATELAWFLSKQ